MFIETLSLQGMIKFQYIGVIAEINWSHYAGHLAKCSNVVSSVLRGDDVVRVEDFRVEIGFLCVPLFPLGSSAVPHEFQLHVKPALKLRIYVAAR